MAQFLRVSSRRSRVLRHADRVLVVGDLSARPRTRERLTKFFGDGLTVAERLDADATKAADAIMLVGDSAAPLGVASAEALIELARGRQVVCDLGVLASLLDEDVLAARPGSAGAAVVKNDAYFLDGFGCGDVLAWAGGAHATRGKAFGYRATELRLVCALEDYDGRMVALEWRQPDARIAAFDLAALEADGGASDQAGLLVGQALGAEAVDLGQYQAPWRSYAAHIEHVETWAALHADLVSVARPDPLSIGGRRLRVLSIADDGHKPAVLLSCCTHSHEWAPSHGVFSYLRYLLDGYARGHAWARLVLDNLAIVWVPVVGVDGFDETWARGVMVPYGPNWVDLNRNYPPQELWEAFDGGDRGRPKGARPLSEPETRILSEQMLRLRPRGVLAVDYHEQACRGMCVHTHPDRWIDGVGATLGPVFAGRYLGKCLSGYNAMDDLDWHDYTAPQPLGAACTAANYESHIGYPHAMVAEFFGNDDFSPYHIVARTDASATFTEHVLGGVLGRTAYNHQARPRPVSATFPELPPDENLRRVRIDPDGRIESVDEFRAADGLNETLEQGQRVVALRSQWKLPAS